MARVRKIMAKDGKVKKEEKCGGRLGAFIIPGSVVGRFALSFKQGKQTSNINTKANGDKQRGQENGCTNDNGTGDA